MRIAVPDNQGLVWAYKLSPVEVCGCEVLADEEREPRWLHFNLNDARARRWLERANLPPDALALFLDTDTRCRVRVFPDALALVVSDMHHDFDHRALDADAAAFGALRIYVDGQRVITGRSHPLKCVDLMRRELARGSESNSPFDVLVAFLERLPELFAETVGALGVEIDDAEDDILARRFGQQGAMLSRGRRLLARLRRHLNANIAALAPATDAIAALVAHEQRSRVAQAIARLSAVAQELEYVQERSRLLQEEIANHLSETTNKNLYLLSIVTTALLPITLITGIFGMNVGGLPWAHNNGGFLWAMLLIAATVVVTFMLLRRRGQR